MSSSRGAKPIGAAQVEFGACIFGGLIFLGGSISPNHTNVFPACWTHNIYDHRSPLSFRCTSSIPFRKVRKERNTFFGVKKCAEHAGLNEASTRI